MSRKLWELYFLLLQLESLVGLCGGGALNLENNGIETVNNNNDMLYIVMHYYVKHTVRFSIKRKIGVLIGIIMSGIPLST